MKVVKFRDYLVPMVVSGEKTSTWRLFDDKDLSIGDEIELREFGQLESFAHARITNVVEKLFRDFTDDDKRGHEPFETDQEMYQTYSEYYQAEVGPDTIAKIIWFELI